MATVVPDQLAEKQVADAEETGYATETKGSGGGQPSLLPLGEPQKEKKFWFQRNQHYEPNAIATQVRIVDFAQRKFDVDRILLTCLTA